MKFILSAIAALALVVPIAAGAASRPPHGPNPCTNTTQYNKVTGECHGDDTVVNAPPPLYTGGN